MIVEKVAGKPLLAFLQQQDLQAARHARAIDQDLAIGKAYPQGYRRNALGPVRVETPAARRLALRRRRAVDDAPSDLAKWDIARMNRTLLPADDWAGAGNAGQADRRQATPATASASSPAATNGRRYVEHSGEAVGFLSENIVYPDDKAAIVVLINSWFGDAYRPHRRAASPRSSCRPRPPAPRTPPRSPEPARVFDQLRTGTLDRAALTDDANYYFTPTALADYRDSLGTLGEPTAFAQTGTTRLRGGFVNRNYTRHLSRPRRCRSVTYAEPGANGRYEQFLVTPAE